jgi:hypothetical protein
MLPIKLSFSNLFARIFKKNRQSSISFAAYFVLFLIVALYTLSQPLVLARYGHDVIIYFDYVYRLLSGLTPGDGIWTAYGSLLFWYMAGIYKIIGYSTSMIWLTILTIFLIWLPLFIKSNNFGKFKFILISSLLFGLYHLGDNNAITYANFYNRICYFIMLGVIIFCPEENEDNFYNYIAGVSLFILLNIKISYFILTLIHLFIFRRKFFLDYLKFFLLLESIYLIFVDHSLMSYIKMNELVSNIYKPYLKERIYDVINFKQQYIKYYIYIPIVSYLLGADKKLLIKVLCSNFLILIAQQFNYLLSAEPIIILNLCFMLDLFRLKLNKIFKGFLLLSILYGTSCIASDHVHAYLLNKKNKTLAYQNFSSDFNIKGLYIKNADGLNNSDYLSVIKQAMELTNTCKSKYKNCNSILVVSFEDFVSREAGLKPARVSLIPFHFNFSFNADIHPDSKSMFQDLNFILIRPHDFETADPFRLIYKTELQTFKICEQSQYWHLLCRK